MIRRHFATRAEVERQMAAPHQLRAETLGGALWMLRTFAGAAAALCRQLLGTTAHRPRSAWSARTLADTTSSAHRGFGS